MAIDFLSDTVTKPTPRMREAMYQAEVGDDGYGEDPTVTRLEALAAERLGKESACFVASGTMANLTAILAHCPRGFELLVGDESDLYNYEAGGPSVIGGIVLHPITTERNGQLSLTALELAIRDPMDFQCAPAGLITLENPHVRCGGIPLDIDYLQKVKAFASAHNIPVHMDGARVFNAAVAQGVCVADIAAYADSIQFCLSKSLAAPVGSILAGDHDFIQKVRRWRKLLGGSMRQAGVLAAAGIVALEDMVDRLFEDHKLAHRLAQGLSEFEEIAIDMQTVQTNMVFFSLVNSHLTQAEFLQELLNRDIRMAELGKGRIRAVVNYHHNEQAIDQTLDTISNILRGR